MYALDEHGLLTLEVEQKILVELLRGADTTRLLLLQAPGIFLMFVEGVSFFANVESCSWFCEYFKDTINQRVYLYINKSVDRTQLSLLIRSFY